MVGALAVYSEGALAPHGEVCSQTSWVQHIFHPLNCFFWIYFLIALVTSFFSGCTHCTIFFDLWVLDFAWQEKKPHWYFCLFFCMHIAFCRYVLTKEYKCTECALTTLHACRKYDRVDVAFKQLNMYLHIPTWLKKLIGVLSSPVVLSFTLFVLHTYTVGLYTRNYLIYQDPPYFQC